MKLSVEKQNSLLDLYLASSSKDAESLSLPSAESEIKEFISLADHNKASANLFIQMKRFYMKPEDLLKKPLEEAYDKTRLKNIKRLEAGLPVLKELKLLGVEIIILKGNAIAEDLFQDIGYKPMNDIDILIQKKDLALVHEIFQKHGLLVAAPLESDIRKQEKYSHHWPPFFDKKMNVFFGTHWDIAAHGRQITTPLKDFWQDKEEFELMGERFYRLAPKHFILHLCIHLNSAKTGLREIGDIVKVIEAREKDLDVDEFVKVVIKSNTVKEVYEALSLSKALKASLFIDAVLERMQGLTGKKFRTLVKKRSSPRHKLLHIRTNYISKIEKTFALFMLTESPLEKTFLLARMWRLYLLVPAEEALRLSYDFPKARFAKRTMARATAPLKISQVFIKDMGFAIFLIVTARHQWVLLKSYFTYFMKVIRDEPIHDLDSYAKQLGLTFKEMKEISALD